MSNRRDIKKEINRILGDVIEECYSEMIQNPRVNEDKINAIIDDAVDLADDLIGRVNSSKKLKSGKEMKTAFQAVSNEVHDKAIGYIEKLNSL